MVLLWGLKMNKTCQFIEVFERRSRRQHKMSMQYELQKNIGALWTTYNSN